MNKHDEEKNIGKLLKGKEQPYFRPEKKYRTSRESCDRKRTEESTQRVTERQSRQKVGTTLL